MKKKLIVLFAIAGCGGGAAVEPTPGPTPAINAAAAPPPPAVPPRIAGDHADRILAAAAEYLSYGRVDDEMRWAPGLCRAQQAGRTHMSAAEGSGAHQQKLYSVLAKDHDEYFAATSPVGQVVVKESWKPERVDPGTAIPSPYLWRGTADFAMGGTEDHFYPYLARGGEIWKATEPAGLYIMIKIGEAATPGTDQGWIYGTVDAAGELTGAGAIETCKGCHADAPRDRLFGLGQTEPAYD
jgi:hypothetical protein